MGGTLFQIPPLILNLQFLEPADLFVVEDFFAPDFFPERLQVWIVNGGQL